MAPTELRPNPTDQPDESSALATGAGCGLHGAQSPPDGAAGPVVSAGVTRVVVDVMLKPEILDPQGQAVVNALPRLGVSGIVGVRQGKRFELELADGVALDGAVLARVEHLASTLLANPVIEDYVVRVEDASAEPSASTAS